MKIKHNQIILPLITLIFIGLVWTTDNPFWWGLTTLFFLISLNLWFKNKRKPKENLLDNATIATIVLTIVLISISVPILQPRVEIIGVSQPYSISIEETGAAGYRNFDFQVIKPIIPFFTKSKEISIANRIYYVYQKDYQRYGTMNYIIGIKSPNKLVFKNNNYDLGYDKEFISLRIQTDLPLENIEQETDKNITSFYRYPNTTNSCGSLIWIINFQNESIMYNKNITIFISNNASKNSYTGFTEPFLKSMGDYRKGYFGLTLSSDKCYSTPFTFFEVDNGRINSSKGLYVTFYSGGIINPGSNPYNVVYIPTGVRTEYQNISF